MRFTWNGRRCSETLPYPVTPKGIAAASILRDQVVRLSKMGLMDDAKYIELFPGSMVPAGGLSCFGEFAQLWLDSRDITQGTRLNYKSTLNHYWMPHLALIRIDLITTTLLRRIIAETKWTSSGVKRNALVKLSTILKAALGDGLIERNPAETLEVPRRSRKDPDPLTLDDANRIIEKLYSTSHWPSLIYAALFEFLFFSGLRLSEALALRWESVDWNRKQVHVCRTVALGVVEERTKTKSARYVLLNERALRALWFALNYAERRQQGVGRVKTTPYVFPPSKGQEYIKQTSNVHHQWRPTLKALGIRYRPPYNCRHTYATICLMSGMNPAFISQQLGHSVQMLLSTYARWINSSSDWSELEKLNIGIKLVSTSFSQP
ncbi:site-specific integrase [Pseudomonas peli]|uniref:site-specific integrase n=1 Tax=Pseudomonas peli TaxID=592361 RepID=UPI001FC9C315|nr:site-specific integrase [Pseudomonas peli]